MTGCCVCGLLKLPGMSYDGIGHPRPRLNCHAMFVGPFWLWEAEDLGEPLYSGRDGYTRDSRTGHTRDPGVPRTHSLTHSLEPRTVRSRTDEPTFVGGKARWRDSAAHTAMRGTLRSPLATPRGKTDPLLFQNGRRKQLVPGTRVYPGLGDPGVLKCTWALGVPGTRVYPGRGYDTAPPGIVSLFAHAGRPPLPPCHFAVCISPF